MNGPARVGMADAHAFPEWFASGRRRQRSCLGKPDVARRPTKVCRPGTAVIGTGGQCGGRWIRRGRQVHQTIGLDLRKTARGAQCVGLVPVATRGSGLGHDQPINAAKALIVQARIDVRKQRLDRVHARERPARDGPDVFHGLAARQLDDESPWLGHRLHRLCGLGWLRWLCLSRLLGSSWCRRRVGRRLLASVSARAAIELKIPAFIVGLPRLVLRGADSAGRRCALVGASASGWSAC